LSQYQFTLESYIAIVKAILAQGYQTVSYEGASPREKHLILRHDIDFDLDAAVEMAECERRHGLKATYFILLRTEFYNVASGQGLKAVESC